MAEHDVTVRETVEASPDRVWTTLTDPAATTAWMGAAAESAWQPGAPITWTGEWQGKEFTDRGEVIEADEPRSLVHTHGSGDGPAHRLHWTLRPEGERTELTLVQSGAESEEQAAEFERNWSMMLGRLKEAAES